jgi:carbon-monoxide dehydrogenase large subunit
MITESDLPYTTATQLIYRSVYPRDTLERALAMLDYQEARRQQAEARAAGRIVGIGIATYVEPNTYGSEFYKTAGIPGSGHDAAIVRIEPSGAVSAQIGVVSQGQGHLTTVAQALADALTVPIEKVRVQSGDTAAAPYGMGTRGARGGVVSAGAALGAVRIVKDKLLRIAAHLLEAPLDDLELVEGAVRVRGVPASSMTIGQLAQKAYLAPTELPVGMEPGLEATTFYDPPNFVFPFGAHLAVVEVDPETGHIELKRYVAVDDCGPQINPMIVEGQVHGGIAQGIGQALFEELAYDPVTGQLLAGSFMDYAMPRADDMPPFEVDSHIVPTQMNPLGAKGVGEAGTVGALPALMNAVSHALAPLGVRHLDMPVTPERIWRAINAARPRG